MLANPSSENQRSFLDVVDGWGLDAAARARVTPVPLVNLPARIASDAFHVFHAGGWGAFLPGLHRLRAAHAPRPWPIAGIIFSIHGREMLDYAVRLAHAGLTTADAIACLSRDGLDAFTLSSTPAAPSPAAASPVGLVPIGLGVDDDVLDVEGDRAAGRRRLQIPDEAVALLVLGRITPAQKMDLAPLLKVFTRSRPISAGGGAAGHAGDRGRRQRRRRPPAAVAVDTYGVRARARTRQLPRPREARPPRRGRRRGVGRGQHAGDVRPQHPRSARPRPAGRRSRFDGYNIVDDGVDGLLVDTLWCEADPLAGLGDVMDADVELIQAQSVAIDTEQLADHLRALIADEPRRLSMGAGRTKVRERFRASAVVRQYEALWDELAADAARLDDWRTPRPIAPTAAAADPAALSPSSLFRSYPPASSRPTTRSPPSPASRWIRPTPTPPCSSIGGCSRRSRPLSGAGPRPRRGRARADRGTRLVRRDVATEVQAPRIRVASHG